MVQDSWSCALWFDTTAHVPSSLCLATQPVVRANTGLRVVRPVLGQRREGNKVRNRIVDVALRLGNYRLRIAEVGIRIGSTSSRGLDIGHDAHNRPSPVRAIPQVWERTRRVVPELGNGTRSGANRQLTLAVLARFLARVAQEDRIRSIKGKVAIAGAAGQLRKVPETVESVADSVLMYLERRPPSLLRS